MNTAYNFPWHQNIACCTRTKIDQYAIFSLLFTTFPRCLAHLAGIWYWYFRRNRVQLEVHWSTSTASATTKWILFKIHNLAVFRAAEYWLRKTIDRLRATFCDKYSSSLLEASCRHYKTFRLLTDVPDLTFFIHIFLCWHFLELHAITV